MKRRTNIINNVLSMALTFGALIAVVLICNNNYIGSMFEIIGFIILGAIISGFIVATTHELGHLIAGRHNGFNLYCIVIWFFKWVKIGKKTNFSFTLPFEEAGYTEMIPTKTDNLSKRFAKMTKGGIYGPLVLMIIGIAPLVLVSVGISLPLIVFAILSMLFPMGAYYLFGNILPMSSYGVLNDGALLLSLKRNDDVAKVTVALLNYQAELYNGKTPSEIDESLIFDLPQLPEDNPSFAMILDARYNYYLDKEDFENAKKVSDRLMGLLDEMPKNIKVVAQTNALYNACTFDYNEEKADDLMYELEKFLNNVNTALTVRAKLAYILYVKKDKESLEMFYKKGLKECKRCPMIGMGAFEQKLFEKMKKDF